MADRLTQQQIQTLLNQAIPFARPGFRYCHREKGMEVQVIQLALSADTETPAVQVVYRCAGGIWTRSVEEFKARYEQAEQNFRGI